MTCRGSRAGALRRADVGSRRPDRGGHLSGHLVNKGAEVPWEDAQIHWRPGSTSMTIRFADRASEDLGFDFESMSAAAAAAVYLASSKEQNEDADTANLAGVIDRGLQAHAA